MLYNEKENKYKLPKTTPAIGTLQVLKNLGLQHV